MTDQPDQIDADDFHQNHIEVAPIDDETGLNILIRDKIVLTISWEQAQSLNTLLCVELDQWLHRQGKWSMQITKAGPVHLPAGHADEFADGVLGNLDLSPDELDEVRPALTDWFDNWATDDENPRG